MQKKANSTRFDILWRDKLLHFFEHVIPTRSLLMNALENSKDYFVTLLLLLPPVQTEKISVSTSDENILISRTDVNFLEAAKQRDQATMQRGTQKQNK